MQAKFAKKAGEIKTALIQSGKTQKELAKAIGVSERTLNFLFTKGEASLKTIDLIDGVIKTWTQNIDDRQWVRRKVDQRLDRMQDKEDRLEMITSVLKADPHLAELAYYALEIYKLLKGKK